ncbi:uncharacterized protein LOC144101718 isoform X3 [Amblyomma americanum]
MRTTTCCLLLAAAFFAVACADSPDIHPTCRLDDRRLKTVVACVKRNGGVAATHTTKEFFTDEEKAIVRSLFATCHDES